MEVSHKELVQEIDQSRAMAEITEVTETMEQQEMKHFAEAEQNEYQAVEQQEMDEGVKIGYSSDYYEHQMATALENGNKIAYDHAKRDWAKAIAREETKNL